MGKLGYTWYPKDWGMSDKVFELSLSERGLYREFIDMAYSSNNQIEVKINVWVRKFGCEEEDLKSIMEKLISLGMIEYRGENIFVPSCDKRIKIADKNRRNGKAGGRPSNPDLNPNNNPNNNPNLTQDERQRERESKSEREYIFLLSEKIEIENLWSYIEENFQLQIPNWKKVYPDIDLEATCKTFQLENAGKEYNDKSHLRNAINRHWKILKDHSKPKIKKSKNSNLFTV